MKAALLPLLSVVLCTGPLCAQWSGGPNGPIYYNGGNVGIGTTSPMATLEVNGPARIDGSGLFNWAGSTGVVNLGDSNHGIKATFGSGVTLFTAGVPSGIFLQQGTGNVGIGTTNPQYPLQVNGTIAAPEVTVTTGLSDYVFDPAYHLLPLQEVAGYINQNHHLPGIPSDAEAKEKGVSLGDLQAKLLAKIEELTLHMIQAEDRNNRLEQHVANLEHQLTELKQKGPTK